jgi:excisionase family DNA binding protein
MANPDTLPQLMTIDQLAERLGVTTRHIRRLVAERRVPYLKVTGSKWIFELSECPLSVGGVRA